MPEDAWVRVAQITVPARRMRSTNHIEELAASIARNGLIHPITLRRDGAALVLVAGKRRLEAMKLLRQAEIRARILDVDELNAQLIEIDENLQRAELTALERGQHAAERQKIWEGLHPETKQGGAPAIVEDGGGRGKLRGKKSKDEMISSFETPAAPRAVPASFAVETARAIQSSPSTIERSVRIGEGLCREAKELLTGTPVEDRKVDVLSPAPGVLAEHLGEPAFLGRYKLPPRTKSRARTTSVTSGYSRLGSTTRRPGCPPATRRRGCRGARPGRRRPPCRSHR